MYRGRLKNPSIKTLIWYDDNKTIKSLHDEYDFVLSIEKGDEHLIDILKERNDLEFLKLNSFN